MMSKLEFIKDWEERMGTMVPLSESSVIEYVESREAALRAQADAAPIGTLQFVNRAKHGYLNKVVYTHGGAELPDGTYELYTHSSLPAAQGLSDEARKLIAYAAEFIGAAVNYGQNAPDEPPGPVSQWDYDAHYLAQELQTLLARAATVAEPSEACRECNGAGKVDVTHSPLRDGYTETVRECCGTCGGTGKSEVSDGEREIREIWTTQAERENAQRTRMLDRFANRAATPATADFDLIAPNDAQAAQQQAEPSEKLEAPAQVGSTVFRTGVEKRLVVEAAQRLYQFRHNPTEEEKRIADASASIARLRAHLAEKESRDD